MSDELMPEGKYAANPVECGFIETKNGHPQYAIECVIAEGPYAGRSLTKVGSVESEQGQEYTIRDLRTCGWTGDDVLTATIDRDVAVRIHVVHDTYDGKTRAKLKAIYPLGGGGLLRSAAMGDARKRELAAKMNRLARGAGGATNGASPATAPGFAAPSEEADLPF